MDTPAPSAIDALEQRVRRNLGRVLFTTRWVMAPIYLGLLVALGLLAVKFIQQLITAIQQILTTSSTDTILEVLSLVDLTLVANLVVIVLLAGWENFVGRLLAAQSAERPEWLSSADFTSVKLRLIASIAAIAAVQMLETFMHINTAPPGQALWQLAILVGVAITGLLLAAMDWLGGSH
jgi:uncharacterized protein (TIGR00645 family)